MEQKQNLSDVSFTLANHVISDRAKDANFVFSPLSIHVALAFIAAGSDGPRRDTLLRFLKSESTEQLNNSLLNLVSSVFAYDERLRGPRVSLANGIWIDQSLTFKPSFRQTVENVYNAASQHVDFQNKADEVRREVNRWCEKETNGLIKNILGPGSVNNMTRLIFANAVYFKAMWVFPFDPKRTRDDEFFLLNGSSIQVPFMRSREDQFIGCYEGFKVLRLPYARCIDRKHHFSMYIYLPDDRQGLPTLVEKAGSISGFVDRHIPCEQVPVDRLQVPKFKIEFGFEASEILQKHGVVLDGGLTEMVNEGGEDLFVSRILHKSFIEVNEQGTEAAAVTLGASEGCAGDDIEHVDFVADHPFMFVIREDVSGAVLFIGQLFDPLAGGNVVPKRKLEMDRETGNGNGKLKKLAKKK